MNLIKQKLIRKQYLILLGMFILLLTTILGQLTPTYYLDLDSDSDDYYGVNNFTNNGVTFDGNAGDFEESESDHLIHPTKTVLYDDVDSTHCMQFKPESQSGYDLLFSNHNQDSNSGFSFGINQAGQPNGFSAVIFNSGNNWVHSTMDMYNNVWTSVCIVYHAGNDSLELWFNGTMDTVNTGTAIVPNSDTNNELVYGAWDHSILQEFDGVINETCFFNNTAFSSVEINEYLQYGCLGDVGGGGPTPDTTPPVLSVSVQSPSNFTIEDIYDVVNVTINITDNVELNLSSILLNLSLNNSQIYINGTLQPVQSFITYASNSSAEFLFELDEHNLIPASYPLNPDIEDQFHENKTFTSANHWAKMQFFNVSNNVRQAFFEVSDENITGGCLAQYYYCNSSYTTGNPSSQDECVIFFEGNNSQGSYHSHEQVTHQIIPMGIDTATGTLNGLPVTPEIFILKRGTACGERLYYVTNVSRTSQSQTTTNNGNTWNDLSGTFNAHIHQIGENSSFYYNICAQDNASNSACTSVVVDVIDFPILRPNAVDIFVPVVDTYNGTMVINHSESFSSSGQTIQTYTYYYVTAPHELTLIGENNHPDTTISWNTENVANGDYHLEIHIKDSLNLTTITDSETFTINNPVSLTNQLLTSQNTILNNIYGVINLIPIVLIWIVLTLGAMRLLLMGYYMIGYSVYFLSSLFDLIILAMTYINFSSYVSNSVVGFLISISLVILIPFALLTRLFVAIKISKS